jgi:hypothetical protein
MQKDQVSKYTYLSNNYKYYHGFAISFLLIEDDNLFYAVSNVQRITTHYHYYYS